jgi:hypothetical protein
MENNYLLYPKIDRSKISSSVEEIFEQSIFGYNK